MAYRFLFSLLCAVLLLQAQEKLSNESILKMASAGLSEVVILSTINHNPGAYTTSVQDLIALKQAGLSDKVIAAMINKAVGDQPVATSRQEAVESGNAQPPQMEIGIYTKKGETWTEVLPEVVNWKTGGTLKSLASAGIVKKDINGNLIGPASRNTVKTPLDFLIVAPEGVSITEYQLIRLRLNKDYREFRTITGGILNQQSGAMRDMVPFEGKRVSPRVFAVTLPTNLGAGEYGFLSPGAVGSSGNSAAQIGKMYTFRIIE